MQKKINIYKPFSDFSKTVIINSVVSISYAVIYLIFSFVRTALIKDVYGLAELGLLAMAVGILPYISSTHGGMGSVSRYNLYNKVYNHQYNEVNQTVANLKMQYYFFGGIYSTIIIIIAFAFPFFFNTSGNIKIDETIIPWWQGSLYILSNCIETAANYFIVPISIILFFIIKKSYISNGLELFATIFFNGIVIALLLLQKYYIIDINFVIMNTIITALLGTKIIIVLLLLIPIRKWKIKWYERKKSTNKKISKNMVFAVLSQYLKQFNSDIFSIVFILATIFIPETITTYSQSIELFHAGHDHSSIGSDGFSLAGTYSIFLFLISSSYEIVHSIIESAIPSMAEHITKNKKIDKTFFNRYNSLIVFICVYAITTYIFTAPFSSIFLMNLHLEANQIILMFLIMIPMFIDIKLSGYDHLLPIFGDFKKIIKFNLIKVLSNVLLTAGICGILCSCLPNSFLVGSIYISICLSWAISSSIYYLVIYLYMNKWIENHKINWLKEISNYTYVILSVTLMAFVFGFMTHEIDEHIADLSIGWNILILFSIGTSNIGICMLNMKLTLKSEFNYFLKEFICMKNHYQSLYSKKIKTIKK